MIEDLLQVWNSTSAKWENYIIYKYEYDSNENNVSYLRQDWNNSTSQWINIWLHLGTFDNNNLLAKDLYQEWNSSNVWENVVLNLYTYDESFNETEKIVQTWNLESSIWENESKHNYSYVNNLNMDYYYFYWDLDIQDWIIWYRDLYSYDENENQTGYVSEDWDNQNLVWINYERAFFNFNEQNILMSELYQSWNLNLNDWINSTKIDYTLTQIPTEISEEKFALENTFELHQNYPNPFNPTTKIKYSIPDNSNLQQKVVLKIYNVLGQVVKTLVNENKLSGIYEIEFNGSDLMSGIYFYKINFGSFEQTKKMILLK
ncbi:MAG: T9SS type A sorting domain-containing protein [Ignavibacteriae bacterium]|nr:T9SS type A sorting domain-containing protein [Ignavibacteriota bacterium]